MHTQSVVSEWLCLVRLFVWQGAPSLFTGTADTTTFGVCVCVTDTHTAPRSLLPSVLSACQPATTHPATVEQRRDLLVSRRTDERDLCSDGGGVTKLCGREGGEHTVRCASRT